MDVQRNHERLRNTSFAYGKILAGCLPLQLQQQIGHLRTVGLDMLSNLSISNREQDKQPA